MELSKDARNRLRWMEHYEKYKNARLTCRHFAISPDTFYLWKRRFDKDNLASLEDTSSRRPKKLRTNTWSPNLLKEVKQLKKRYHNASKYIISDHLHRKGYTISVATVGRILKRGLPRLNRG